MGHHRAPAARGLGRRIARCAIATAVVATGAALTAQVSEAVQDPVSCPNTTIALGNGGFESPVIAGNSFSLRNESQLGGWQTTAPDNLIELWRVPFQGVTPAEGAQHAELNANSVATLYQDVATVPGTEVTYRVFHRGRSGVDTAQMQFGPPAGPADFTRTMTDGNKAWGSYTGTYTIPAGQTTTRFAFASISAAGGNGAIGNFIDGVQFGTPPCVTTTKTVTNLAGTDPAHAGDQLQYDVTVANGGGNDAASLVVNDAIPAGTAYVPGSLEVVSGPGSGTKSDGAGDDQAEFDPVANRVRFRVGTSANATTGGTLGSSGTTAVRFRVTVLPTDGPTTITNAAATAWEDLTHPGAVQTSTSNDVTTTVTKPAISLVKAYDGYDDLNGNGSISVGDRVHYSITARNVGSEDLTSVTIADPRATPLTCAATTSGGNAFVNGSGTLDPGDSIVCRGTITVTLDDVNNGAVVNTATVTGVGTAGLQVAANDQVVVSPEAAEPSLVLVKAASPSAGAKAGDTITYTVAVTNNGNVTLTKVLISDPSLSGFTCPAPFTFRLLPAQTKICTGTRVVTQADVDAGSITNTATATGAYLTETVEDDDTIVTPTIPRVGLLRVTKGITSHDDLDDNGSVSTGDVLHYGMTVTNAGTVTQTNVTLTDALVSGLACAPAQPATLAPGASMTCSGDHAVTQEDVDAGEIVNVATATGTPPPGVVNPPAEVTVDTPTEPVAARLDVAKSAALLVDADVSGSFTPGDTVRYRIDVANTGNVTLTGVTVSDPLLPGLVCIPAIPATVPPGGQISCAGLYVLTADDATAGTRDNTATATGTPPTGPAVEATDDVSLAITTPDPAVELAKTLSGYTDADSSGSITPGDLLSYTLIASNTGNVALDEVTIDDPTTPVTCAPTVPATLAPGTQMVCVGSHLVTQADQDAGGVVNAAKVTGVSPQDETVADTDELEVATEGRFADAELTKVVAGFTDDNDNGAPDVGEDVTYTLTFTNRGNVTLGAASIADDRIATLDCEPGQPVSLAPGDALVCTGTLTVSQVDQDSGVLVNHAAGTGETQLGPITRTAEADVIPAPAQPALETTKVGAVDDEDGSGAGGAGETVTYTITATNTGNVTLSGVTVTDPLLAELSCAPVTPATVAPGASVVCIGGHTISQAEVDAGQIDNVATATGQDPRGIDTTGVGATTTPTDEPDPALVLDKTAGALVDRDADGRLSTSDLVPFTIVATNTGNVTLHGVTVRDEQLSSMVCNPVVPADLAPAQSVTCTGSHVVTSAEEAAGVVRNTASADADDTYGPFPAVSDSAEVRGVPAAAPVDMPRTGRELSPLILAGLAMFFAGAGLVATARRRRRRPAGAT